MKKMLLGGIAAAAMMSGGIGMIPAGSHAMEAQGRVLQNNPTPAPERLVSISGQTETAKERFDRLRGTTPRGRSSGQNRTPGDRAHKRMKRRRAASHHGA